MSEQMFHVYSDETREWLTDGGLGWTRDRSLATAFTEKKADKRAECSLDGEHNSISLVPVGEDPPSEFEQSNEHVIDALAYAFPLPPGERDRIVVFGGGIRAGKTEAMRRGAELLDTSRARARMGS